jgi:SAM-dependent methyltransferase
MGPTLDLDRGKAKDENGVGITALPLSAHARAQVLPGITMDHHIFQHLKRNSVPFGIWSCWIQEHDATNIEFCGFFVPPFLLSQQYTIVVNGDIVPIGPDPRAAAQDIFKRFDLLRDDPRKYMFSFSIKLLSAHQEISIQILPQNTTPAALFPYYFSHSYSVAAPSEQGMMRTTHISDIEIFNFTGLTEFRRIQQIYHSTLPRSQPPTMILDWGCGCGRVSRFAEKEWGEDRVYGVDIDPVNIEWDQKNLSDDRYKLIEFVPALPFSENTFDLVYGISVMTHLKSSDQTAWLREVHRIIKPCGIALLTFHGLPAFFAHVNDGTSLEYLIENGMWNQGRNSDLDVSFENLKNQDIYHNVFNLVEDIAAKTDNLFKIVRFIPGGHMAQHDYIVLQKL